MTSLRDMNRFTCNDKTMFMLSEHLCNQMQNIEEEKERRFCFLIEIYIQGLALRQMCCQQPENIHPIDSYDEGNERRRKRRTRSMKRGKGLAFRFAHAHISHMHTYTH